MIGLKGKVQEKRVVAKKVYTQEISNNSEKK